MTHPQNVDVAVNIAVVAIVAAVVATVAVISVDVAVDITCGAAFIKTLTCLPVVKSYQLES